MLLFCLTALIWAAPPARQFSAHYLPAQSTRLVASDAAGNLFIVSTSASGIRVTSTDTSGHPLATFDFGGPTDSPAAAAIDPAGNLVIGGSTQASDFPLVSPVQTTGSGFLTKIDPQLRKILFSTRLSTPIVGGVVNSVSAITFDSAANIYVTGTAGAGMPVTPGAFQSQAPALSSSAIASHGFVAEISAAGDKLLFSTYYTGGAARCARFCGGFPVGPVFIETIPAAIALDASGAVIIAGRSDVDDLSVTPGAYAPQCGCGPGQFAGFVAKLGSAGTKLIWGTYLPLADASGYNAAGLDGVGINALALDSAGNVLLAGTTLRGFPTTPDAFQATFPPGAGALLTPPKAGFVARLDPSGARLLYSTYFGGNVVGNTLHPYLPQTGVGALAVDSQGAIWLTGLSAPAALPQDSPAALGQNYVAALSPDARTVAVIYTAPDGSAGSSIAVTPQGTVAAIGYPNSLLIARASAGPSVLGIAGSPAFRVAEAVAPRELISIYGLAIGPADPLSAQVTGGVIASSLGGVQVLFDGQPAALLYAGPTQINAIVPSSVLGRTGTAVRIVTPSGTIDGPSFQVQQALPQVFAEVTGHASAVNQDGTWNSASNPAPAGSVVSVWMTGGGALDSSAPDNRINTTTSNNPLPISVQSLAGSIEVLYGGDAPFQPSGLSQVNFRVPPPQPGAPATLEFQLKAGASLSESYFIYVQ